MSLIGDFNGWDKSKNPMRRDSFGNWTCFVPDGAHGLTHNCLVKAKVEVRPGVWEDRVPAWITRVTQNTSTTVYEGRYWAPEHPYQWRHGSPARPKSVRIYETHIGMASPEPKVATYKEFTQNMVPYIADLGYNCVQIMAVMEHAYYASFGYQVTSFFAVSSRFGTPEDLKELIDACHARGINVLLDLVHSHASNNVADGLNMFDGTDSYLFHGGQRGKHELWNSRLFNYGNWETLRFLLSNIAWYMEEYRFDGFRFDGVTSMLYRHHGLGDHTFDYPHMFGGDVDGDALAYLTLANRLIHTLKSDALSIGEDVSGFAGLCRPVSEGGVGFDFRLHMGCPDMWIKLLKTTKDEDWNVNDIGYVLSNRRFMEPCIAYAESHDQALVGDKTIAFWLMDKEMYDHMSVLTPRSAIIDRGIALHKMIRLITMTLGGDGYLTFMGNEFGHPEWIDFPREGNGSSFHHCRRRFDLQKDGLLKYQHLLAFDHAMMELDGRYTVLSSGSAYITLHHESDHVIVYERAGLVFAFNFHPSNSYADYAIPVRTPGEYEVVLSSDDKRFDGFGRIDTTVHSFTEEREAYGQKTSMKVYLPSRTCVVWRRVN